MEFWK